MYFECKEEREINVNNRWKAKQRQTLTTTTTCTSLILWVFRTYLRGQNHQEFITCQKDFLLLQLSQRIGIPTMERNNLVDDSVTRESGSCIRTECTNANWPLWPILYRSMIANYHSGVVIKENSKSGTTLESTLSNFDRRALIRLVTSGKRHCWHSGLFL